MHRQAQAVRQNLASVYYGRNLDVGRLTVRFAQPVSLWCILLWVHFNLYNDFNRRFSTNLFHLEGTLLLLQRNPFLLLGNPLLLAGNPLLLPSEDLLLLLGVPLLPPGDLLLVPEVPWPRNPLLLLEAHPLFVGEQ